MITAESTMNVASQNTLDLATFRAAMACFPTGVAIVTTHDERGTPYGFTASSFCSVSLEPPLILVCLAKSANSYPVFAKCEHFAVSILRPHHAELARRFASKNGDKFAQGRFRRTSSGRIVVDEALAVIECSPYRLYDAGDHVIIVGQVRVVGVAEGGSPAVYFNRGFSTICADPSGHDHD